MNQSQYEKLCGSLCSRPILADPVLNLSILMAAHLAVVSTCELVAGHMGIWRTSGLDITSDEYCNPT